MQIICSKCKKTYDDIGYITFDIEGKPICVEHNKTQEIKKIMEEKMEKNEIKQISETMYSELKGKYDEKTLKTLVRKILKLIKSK